MSLKADPSGTGQSAHTSAMPGGVDSLMRDVRGLQQRYRPGVGFAEQQPIHGIRDTAGNPAPQQGLPMAMEAPSQVKDQLAIKHDLMRADIAGGAGNVVNFSFSDSEMKLMSRWRKLKQYKKFVEWLDGRYDLRKPGMTNFVNELFPGVIKARMEFIDQQADLQKKILKLQKFGPQTREDHELLFLLEQGALQDTRAQTSTYLPGMFNPSFRKTQTPTQWWNIFRGTGDPVTDTAVDDLSFGTEFFNSMRNGGPSVQSGIERPLQINEGNFGVNAPPAGVIPPVPPLPAAN